MVLKNLLREPEKVLYRFKLSIIVLVILNLKKPLLNGKLIFTVQEESTTNLWCVERTNLSNLLRKSEDLEIPQPFRADIINNLI